MATAEMGSTVAEHIYTGEVPAVLQHPEREDRTTSLTVAITYTVGARNQRVLHVQVTDESDAYLLYTLNISEDDFHALKTEQSILVDFATFPSKLVELLRQCQAAAEEEHPKFVAQLSSVSGAPVFTVTETNPFRQLCHLALRLVAGNDAAIKKYLSQRLAEFKAQLAATQDELAGRVEQLHETAALATRKRNLLMELQAGASKPSRKAWKDKQQRGQLTS